MSMRISSLGLAGAWLAAASACAPQSAVPEGEAIECALDEDADYAARCILEMGEQGEFAVHHPDGSFHRLRYTGESGVVASADGAEPVVMQPGGTGDALEFAIGSARYRIERRLLSRAPALDPA